MVSIYQTGEEGMYSMIYQLISFVILPFLYPIVASQMQIHYIGHNITIYWFACITDPSGFTTQ